MSSSGEAPTADGRNQRSVEGAAIDPRSRPAAVGEAAEAAPEKPKRKPKPIMMVILGVLAVGALFYWLHARNFEDTDDAQIDGNISNIGPRVSGTVTAVRVVENQPVKANDVLLEIDPTDLAVAVAQAKASVAQAQAQLQAEDPSVSITETSNTAAMAGADAEILSASAGLTGAEKDVDQLTARLTEAEGNARLAEIERKRG
ncbi:MAG TPA: biotin/lipoyl-binding protein, partial [Polyangia bacterium]